MKYSFVSYLGTDNFLPGILALNESLIKYNTQFPFIVLLSVRVSNSVAKVLLAKRINFKYVQPVINPQKSILDERGFKYTYTKLQIFSLKEYEKIVYLDADMIICDNIESLFDKPHMSAVISGAAIPLNSCWKDLNSGLMVIKPDIKLVKEMRLSIRKLSSKDGSDQGYLQSFFVDWRSNKKLHLPHKFNVPFCYLDEYCNQKGFHFTYTKKKLRSKIPVIHFWGKVKPWDVNLNDFSRKTILKWEQAIFLWWDIYHSAIKDLNGK